MRSHDDHLTVLCTARRERWTDFRMSWRRLERNLLHEFELVTRKWYVHLHDN